ncbi:hypothetical protein HPB52_021322 [Rhipicephalus sanguineus]|uniref:DIX domain-containing protein n=1 Tax=Rhipicephalus sanguineus TaxID=34632 RepID=A0A9D4PDP8_RHISA|nr:hypothetical protein HPB52_021322 [Rhipicephalus sanguineus]
MTKYGSPCVRTTDHTIDHATDHATGVPTLQSQARMSRVLTAFSRTAQGHHRGSSVSGSSASGHALLRLYPRDFYRPRSFRTLSVFLHLGPKGFMRSKLNRLPSRGWRSRMPGDSIDCQQGSVVEARSLLNLEHGPVPSRKVVPPDFSDVDARRRLEANYNGIQQMAKARKWPKTMGLVRVAGRQAAPGGEMSSASTEMTVIGYCHSGETAAYRTKLVDRNITPHRFRSLISKKGNHMYFRRCCQEFGTDVVSEEMLDDNEVLSLGGQDPRHGRSGRLNKHPRENTG